MKFYSEPNHAVMERKVNKQTNTPFSKVLFSFDEKGEYETTDEKLISKLKQHFKYDEENKKHCKKCDFICDNHGELLQHYRTHKKEE